MRRAFSSADRALASRIEANEAATALAVAQALQYSSPQLNPVAEPVLAGYAVFAGVGSPATHALGIGMEGPASEADFDRMEEFFRSRGSSCLIDLCPMADPSVALLIRDRGYRVIEFNNILARSLDADDPFPVAPDGVSVEQVPRGQEQTWMHIVARGFLEQDVVPGEFMAMMAGLPRMADCCLASWNGKAAGGGALGMRDGVATMFGDATVVSARGHGLQQALIQHRLAHASRAGCDLAVAVVVPGTASHRNYERAGFQLVYMRVNVEREWK